MKPTSKPAPTGKRTRSQLTHSIGTSVSRFQDFSNAFDDVAAEILALDRRDLSCMTMLLFGGAASADELAAALHVRRGIVMTTLERLQLAGYARFQPGNGARIELTEHARKWIERIWAPLHADGNHLLGTYPTQQLIVLAKFLQQACGIGDEHQAATRMAGGSVLAGQTSPLARRALASRPAPRAVVRGGQSLGDRCISTTSRRARH